MIFFASNLFFDNSIISARRHFRSVSDMNQQIISNWNRVVCEDDSAYILGGVGEFGYLKELNGQKKVFISNLEMPFFNSYIDGVTPIRNEDYDREMFESYVEQSYGVVNGVNFSGKQYIRLYSGRTVCMTTDLDSRVDFFKIYGGCGDYQRMINNSFGGVNSDIGLNLLYPMSEVDVEELIVRSKGKLV